MNVAQEYNEKQARQVSLDAALQADRERNRGAALLDEKEAVELLAGNSSKNHPTAVWRGTHKKLTFEEGLHDPPEGSIEWVILPDDGSVDREYLQKAREKLQMAADKWYLDGNRTRAQAIEAILPNLTIIGPEKAKNPTVDDLIGVTQ